MSRRGGYDDYPDQGYDSRSGRTPISQQPRERVRTAAEDFYYEDDRQREGGRYQEWAHNLGEERQPTGRATGEPRARSGAPRDRETRDQPRDHPRDKGRGGDEVLQRRVEELEDQLRLLKHQNRLFSTFMTSTEDRLKTLRGKSAQQGRAGGGREIANREERDRGPDRAETPRRDTREDQEEASKAMEKKRRELARISKVARERKESAQQKHGKYSEEDYEEPEREERARVPSALARRAAPVVKDRLGERRPSARSVPRDEAAVSALPVSLSNPKELFRLAQQQGIPVNPDDDGGEVVLRPCPQCGRKFQAEALRRHVAKNICTKERKVFKVVIVDEQLPPSAKVTKPPVKAKSKWRAQRAAFMEAMAAGKEVQQHMAAGKDLRDLPQAKAADPSLDDRMSCPHCGRKFNEKAHERHVPHCKDTKNRPNPVGMNKPSAPSRGAPPRRR